MTSVRISIDALRPGRRLAFYAIAAAAIILLLIAGSAAVLGSAGDSARGSAGRTIHGSTAPPSAAAPQVAAPGRLTSTLSAQQNADIAADIVTLRDTPDVNPSTSKAYPSISANAKSQPDLYARAFVTELLARNYTRPRAELLTWAQSESALTSEPSVVGLVPVELRSRFALWSLTAAPDAMPTPIPSERDWAGFTARNASAQVAIERVVQPVKWAAAVAAGDISDPGITSRTVDAEVTTSWRDGHTTKHATESVSITLNIECAPSRAGCGLVDVVTYDAVAVN